MLTTEYILHAVDTLVERYGTRDPYELCDALGIRVRRIDLKKRLKGFFFYQSRIATIVVDSNVNTTLERILVAHELGHAVLHRETAMMIGFQEMEAFDAATAAENEANLFSAELLLTDGEVLEQLRERSFFQTAQALSVPTALLDYKFRALCERGLLQETMECRDSRYLKKDIGAYDEDHELS